MAFVLDTDTFSLALRGNETVKARIAEYDGLVYLSAVAVREVLKGALASVADAESPNPRFRAVSVADAYDLLLGIVEQITQFPISKSSEKDCIIFRQPHSENAPIIMQSFSELLLTALHKRCRGDMGRSAEERTAHWSA